MAGGIVLTIGLLGLQNSRGAGSQEHADAGGTVMSLRGLDRGFETILCQSKPRKPVVPALKAGQRLIETPIIQRRDLTDTRCKINSLKAAWLQSAGATA